MLILPEGRVICGGAEFCDPAVLAIRLTGLTDGSAMQYQHMTKERPGFLWYDFSQVEFEFYRVSVFR